MNELRSFFGPVRQIILQSTSFCNLDCRYCYLPDRSRLLKLPLEHAERLMHFLAAHQLLDTDIEIRWHAGEPLVLPMSYYREAIERLGRTLPENITVRHSLQTNATLIDHSVAEELKHAGMIVGVSLDGPEHLHDKNRTYRNGRGSHRPTLAGIQALRERSVLFDIIAVLTPDSLSDPDRFYEYFCQFGARRLGLNIEETEGTHRSSLAARDDPRFRTFAARLLDLSRRGPLKIREFLVLEQLIRHRGAIARDTQNCCGVIVSLSASGEVATYSPELLGLRHPSWPSFAIAHIDDLSERSLRESAILQRLRREIDAGVARCQAECPYFGVCGGGRPVNKLYENGSFDSTETLECRLRVKTLAGIVLHRLQDELATSP